GAGTAEPSDAVATRDEAPGAEAIEGDETGDSDPGDASAETSEAGTSEAEYTGYVRLDSPERPSWSARRADALGTIAESFLQHGLETLRPGDRQQIVVHVDVQTLANTTAGQCELEDGPAIAAETARRLACDASLVTLQEDENGEPLDVGRKTRIIPPALRRALQARDRGCRFPGCPHTRYVDAHHIQHWAQGGATKLSNLVQLCRFHHRQVHEGRVIIRHLDDGALRFLRPDGRSFDSPLSPGSPGSSPAGTAAWDGEELAAAHRRQGIRITPRTAATRWRGEHMDYDLAVDCLCQRASKNRPAS
ncbi:MAG TPA: DUF222 domain-containing protein, partial [Steroidobacteraceae bacterium]|nr:DUF222 domain-containing protein [Steroidobacteraceae bacterium]